jgi:hypothetical protein
MNHGSNNCTSHWRTCAETNNAWWITNFYRGKTFQVMSTLLKPWLGQLSSVCHLPVGMFPSAFDVHDRAVVVQHDKKMVVATGSTTAPVEQQHMKMKHLLGGRRGGHEQALDKDIPQRYQDVRDQAVSALLQQQQLAARIHDPQGHTAQALNKGDALTKAMMRALSSGRIRTLQNPATAATASSAALRPPVAPPYGRYSPHLR